MRHQLKSFQELTWILSCSSQTPPSLVGTLWCIFAAKIKHSLENPCHQNVTAGQRTWKQFLFLPINWHNHIQPANCSFWPSSYQAAPCTSWTGSWSGPGCSSLGGFSHIWLFSPWRSESTVSVASWGNLDESEHDSTGQSVKRELTQSRKEWPGGDYVRDKDRVSPSVSCLCKDSWQIQLHPQSVPSWFYTCAPEWQTKLLLNNNHSSEIILSEHDDWCSRLAAQTTRVRSSVFCLPQMRLSATSGDTCPHWICQNRPCPSRNATQWSYTSWRLHLAA